MLFADEKGNRHFQRFTGYGLFNAETEAGVMNLLHNLYVLAHDKPKTKAAPTTTDQRPTAQQTPPHMHNNGYLDTS